jgi:SAM-dependent methyltransferase
MEPAAPADLKYDFAPDLAGDNAHAHQLGAVPPGSRVLELGCATGYLSRWLVEARGCRVVGVELDPVAAERARAFCERVVVGDLDDPALLAGLAGEAFDVVLAGDVLEHLKDPARVLEAVARLLAPSGRVVATIPNVAHGDLRLALLAGRFEYRRLGLLDETHLRFFTHATVRALFEGAGYAVHRVARIRAPLFGTELGVTPADVPPEAVAFVAADPEATTYQFVVVASREADDPALVAARLKAEAAEARAQALEAERDRVAAENQALLASRDEARSALAAAQAMHQQVAAEVEAAHAATREALAAAQARHQDLRTHFDALEARYVRMRKLSLVNPLVLADALWRRAGRADAPRPETPRP